MNRLSFYFTMKKVNSALYMLKAKGRYVINCDGYYYLITYNKGTVLCTHGDKLGLEDIITYDFKDVKDFKDYLRKNKLIK